MTIANFAKLGITYSCYSSFGPPGRQLVRNVVLINRASPWLSRQMDASFVLYSSQLPLQNTLYA